MPNSNAGAIGVYSAVGAADIDHAPTDYEDIDDTKPALLYLLICLLIQ